MINNPILNVIELDEKTIVPDEIWDRINEVKKIVFETISSHSPKHLNFIFTNNLVENVISSEETYKKVADLALKRKSIFIPVRLLCNIEELKKRIINPDRFARFKMSCVKSITDMASKCEVYKPKHPNSFSLDVSILKPEEAADYILSKVKELSK